MSQSNRSPRSSRRRSEVIDLRPVGADGSKPPVLDLKLKRKLLILALGNALPLLFFVALGLGWAMGRVTFSVDENWLFVTLAVLLGAIVLIGACWWVLFPFSVWLRAYPMWYYRHESKLVWAIPTVVGYLFWFAMWVACVLMTLLAVYVLGKGIYSLVRAVSA